MFLEGQLQLNVWKYKISFYFYFFSISYIDLNSQFLANTYSFEKHNISH